MKKILSIALVSMLVVSTSFADLTLHDALKQSEERTVGRSTMTKATALLAAALVLTAGVGTAQAHGLVSTDIVNVPAIAHALSNKAIAVYQHDVLPSLIEAKTAVEAQLALTQEASAKLYQTLLKEMNTVKADAYVQLTSAEKVLHNKVNAIKAYTLAFINDPYGRKAALEAQKGFCHKFFVKGDYNPLLKALRASGLMPAAQ